MARTFRHLDRDWQADSLPWTSFQYASLDVIDGASPPPPPSPSSPVRRVRFECISCQPPLAYDSEVYLNVADASEEQLRQALDSALNEHVLGALRDNRWDWRTVEGLARDIQMQPDLVRQLLESMPDKVIRSRERDSQGRTLYAAREDYARKRGLLE